MSGGGLGGKGDSLWLLWLLGLLPCHDAHNGMFCHTFAWCACSRKERYGPNALTPPKVVPWYIKLGLKFVDPFMLLLEVRLLPGASLSPFMPALA